MRSSWPPSSKAHHPADGEEGIRCKVYGRVKHTYSIYRKMFAQNKTLDEIFDLYAFRVIVDDIPSATTCWAASTTCSSRCWAGSRTISAPPSPTCTSPSTPPSSAGRASPFEVQIRTWEMHQTAEYGIAAHWKYKQGMANKQAGHRAGLRVGAQAAGEPAGHRRGGVRPHPEGGYVCRRGVRLHPNGRRE